jgi:two-component system sensor histidine kinase QseC
MSTIRQRLTQRLLLGWSLLLLLGGVVAYGIASAALTHQFDDALYAKALALTSAVEEEHGRIIVESSDQFIREFEATNRMAFFQVWHPNGISITNSPSLNGLTLPLRYGPAESPAFWNLRFADGLATRAVGLRFKPPSDESRQHQSETEAIAVVAVNRCELDASLRTLGLVLGASGLLVIALTAITVPWLLRRELAPLNRLADQAQQITPSSLTERFPMDGLPAELTPISVRLNDLLERLQTAFERERQFSDDLAHEFRTPIAELRSLAEVSLKWPDARGAETDRDVLAIALQMESMINRLLAIARCGRDQNHVEAQRLELAPFISTVCNPMKALAAARQLTIHANVPMDESIRSDPVLLRSILSSLLDNAVEYSPPNATVQVQSEARDGHFMLRVINPVQDLTTDDLTHFFERFWRKDPARSGSEHSGLGLSMSHALATCLGYSLTAQLNGDSHLTMTLSGPTELGRSGTQVSTSATLT